jgi:cellulose 1,4-beta-cellobiosidase
VTTSWATTQPGTGAYDVAYDIWFNTTPHAAGQPDGTELMVWLNHNGPVQPFGSQAGTASIGGRSYNVWYGKQAWNTVSYTMTTPATSVTNLDIGQLTADAVSRGYIGKSWYLIDVEAGFELWQGGAGLATNSFSVGVSGAPGHLPAVTAPAGTAQATPAAAAPPATGTVTSCKVRYAVTDSWANGFQAQIAITNTGKATVNGWALGWTFPGGQRVSQLWNGAQQQSGQRVTVTNASYNSAIAPGAVATFGFTGDGTGANSSPPAFRLNGTACQTA